jgi:hypothetical protein
MRSWLISDEPSISQSMPESDATHVSSLVPDVTPMRLDLDKRDAVLPSALIEQGEQMDDHVLVLDGFPGREAKVIADPDGEVLGEAWRERGVSMEASNRSITVENISNSESTFFRFASRIPSRYRLVHSTNDSNDTSFTKYAAALMRGTDGLRHCNNP